MRNRRVSLVIILLILIGNCSIAWLAVQGNTAKKSEVGTSPARSASGFEQPPPKFPTNATISPPPFKIPPNTTLLPPPPDTPFILSLSSRNVTIHTGKSVSIALNVRSLNNVNVSFGIKLAESAYAGVLPTNTSAIFERQSLVSAANCSTNISLTLLVGNNATLGTYKLVVFAEQRIGVWVVGIEEPLGVTIAS